MKKLKLSVNISIPKLLLILVLTIIIFQPARAIPCDYLNTCYTDAIAAFGDPANLDQIFAPFNQCVTSCVGSNPTGGNSCGADLYNDIHNCGSCGNVCRSVACGVIKPEMQGYSGYVDPDANSLYVALPTCDSGICKMQYISNRFSSNCGDTSYCTADAVRGGGTCEVCPDTWGNCDLDPSNGCEQDLYTDINNCGSCGNVCGPNSFCRGECISNCGNGIKQATEECDNGTTGVNKNTDTPCSIGYGSSESCSYCDLNCTSHQLTGAFCGDGIKQNGYEQCDNGTTGVNKNTDTPCSVAYGSSESCSYCDLNCNSKEFNGAFCGDGTCQASNENYNNCFVDCFKNGWTTDNITGWSLDTSDNILHAKDKGLVLTSTYAINIKANVSYKLSYNIQTSDAYCSINFDFNNGICDSFNDSTQKSCFNRVWALTNSLTTADISIPTNGNATNGVYFKNVNLRLVTGTGCTNISIANLSLVESTYYDDNIFYNNSMIPSSGQVQTAGCCPSNYCWDGQMCVDSVLWTNNASYPGIWNTLVISNWTNNHIDTADQDKATSYRCIIVNSTGNEARWVPSKIKYDWNYERSGYCALATDCFVNDSYPSQGNTYSQGCIHDGETISNVTYALGQGNYYCHMGNWTTRSYVVATLLQNISENSNYVLQCYDNISLVYNLIDDIPLDNVLSACVLIMKKDPITQQIITGVIVDDKSGETVNANIFLDKLKEEYALLYGVEVDPAKVYDDCLTMAATHRVANTNFTICMDQFKNVLTGTGKQNKLKVYYETHYRYFVISDGAVVGIEQETLWNKIFDFFKGLFGGSKLLSKAFSSTDYVTNYDRIYVIRNQSVNVTAVEEEKYNELLKKLATVLYVKYEGTNDTVNPLPIDRIFAEANRSVTDQGGTYFFVSDGTQITIPNAGFENSDNPTHLTYWHAISPDCLSLTQDSTEHFGGIYSGKTQTTNLMSDCQQAGHEGDINHNYGVSQNIDIGQSVINLTLNMSVYVKSPSASTGVTFLAHSGDWSVDACTVRLDSYGTPEWQLLNINYTFADARCNSHILQYRFSFYNDGKDQVAYWDNASLNIIPTTSQELIIQSDRQTGLWQYFTSILRVK